jgi:hypothetical protein
VSSINATAPAKLLKGLATVTNATNPRKTIVKAVITLSLWTVPFARARTHNGAMSIIMPRIVVVTPTK